MDLEDVLQWSQLRLNTELPEGEGVRFPGRPAGGAEARSAFRAFEAMNPWRKGWWP